MEDWIVLAIHEQNNLNRREYNRTIELYSDRIYRYALGLSGSEFSAKDLVQESFLKLWENRRNVPLKNAKAFLFRVLYNRFIDVRRKQARMQSLADIPEQPTKDPHLRHETKELLRLALSGLKPKEQSIIMLRDYEGYSYIEIAKIMGINEGQVKINLFRTRKKLQARIIQVENYVLKQRI